MADSKIAVTVHVLLGLQSPCHQEDSPPALISSAIFRLTSPSTLRLRFLWGWYWHLRTRRSKSHIKLCTILGAHLEIAAFVISKQANTSKNKLLSPASARKITFGFSVSCKWTRQLRHLDSIRVLCWIEGFLTARVLMWHHYEDVIQLIHVRYIGLTMSVALLPGRKLLPEV